MRRRRHRFGLCSNMILMAIVAGLFSISDSLPQTSLVSATSAQEKGGVVKPSPTPRPTSRPRSPSQPSRSTPLGRQPTSVKPTPRRSACVASEPLQASGRGFTQDLGGGVQLEMIEIPAGSFCMGSSDSDVQELLAEAKQYVGSFAKLERFINETPQHRVRVQSFYIGRYEVTQAQWRAVMKNNPSHFQDCDNCPVGNVSWDDTQEFIRRLNGIRSRYTYRLPTEAEWEYAARAGTTGRYAGNLDEMAWYSRDRVEKTQSVGTKQSNKWGLYDMHGNVYEWCEDVWHENYNGAPTDGSGWLRGGDSRNRVMRGGSWSTNYFGIRSAYRDRDASGNRNINYGFRVVAVYRA